ncbi:MAG: M20 family metallopeptidase, partial [Candidatus Nanohaloarchaea archaeon]
MDEPEAKKILSEMIEIKSLPNEEEEITDYLEKLSNKKGFNTRRVNGNIVLEFKNNSNTAIHFNAHMDTVDADPKRWEVTDPWLPKEVNGKLYGRGSSDLKGGITSLIGLAEEIDNIEDRPDVFIEFVRNEEYDGKGSREVIEWFQEKYDYKEEYAVLTEPTNLETIEIGCKG